MREKHNRWKKRTGEMTNYSPHIPLYTPAKRTVKKFDSPKVAHFEQNTVRRLNVQIGPLEFPIHQQDNSTQTSATISKLRRFPNRFHHVRYSSLATN